MTAIVSGDRLTFLINRFRERLWIKPLAVPAGLFSSCLRGFRGVGRQGYAQCRP